ncbi:MAG: bifunctional riboflavin kinase/FAD synthetase [Candidatus Hydrogenedentota bacterium]
MRVIEDVRNCDAVFENLVLTIGSFDGVHCGHVAILDSVVERARAINGTPALMTLHPHPRQLFNPGGAPNILTPLPEKQALVAERGIEVFYILPFMPEVAALDPNAFLERIIVERCHTHTLIVGHDFAFGKGAKGDYEFLKDAAPAYGIVVERVPALYIQGERVGSTVIRERIIQGELDKVEVLLGRKYAIVGEVVRGRGIGGRKLGYPTANIKPHNSAVPAHGVYVAEVLVDGARRQAAVNIGIAPTILQEDVTIEAFILDFDENIVGRDIQIIFHRRVRPEKKYDSLDELIRAIEQDVAAVRAYFAERG